MEQKIRLLHIVRDDKFVDGPLQKFYDDWRFENECVIIVDEPDYQFKLIKNKDRIKILYNKKMVKAEFHRDNYDAIFFYALTDYHIFKYIPNNKIVIWWAWGFDIYGADRFIDIPMYKPQTQQYIRSKTSFMGGVLQHCKNNSLYYYLRDGSRRNAIKRIDYFQPVIHSEYELMKSVKGFKAHAFYRPGRGNYSTSTDEYIFPNHNNSIVIGNSATDTNNHLDVWKKVKDYIPADSSVYFPINYGDMSYSDYLSRTITSDTNKLIFIKDFLPPEEYFKIVDSCTYAIFGVLRQQAMGNIYRCIAKGVKVFLYKDSIPYRFLKDLGCLVFAIDEIDDNSFNTPLTIEQMEYNCQCLKKEIQIIDAIRERAMVEILDRIRK